MDILCVIILGVMTLGVVMDVHILGAAMAVVKKLLAKRGGTAVLASRGMLGIRVDIYTVTLKYKIHCTVHNNTTG